MTYLDGTAANLRAECARQRISGRELARRLGESPMWAQRRLSGAQEMTLDELGRIASALGVDPAQMLAAEGAA